MPKRPTRSYSRHSLEALGVLGGLLRATRIERKIATQTLAERAGISRDMLYRIERGDPRCEIGVVFELATILGIPLFEPDPTSLRDRHRQLRDRLVLLPKAIRGADPELKDDF